MNKVKADVDFSLGIVPASWPVCFVPGCPMAETCLNHLVGLHIPGGRTWGPAFYPTALHDGQCGQYKKIRKCLVTRRLNFGTWQGIYLCEFRNDGGARKVVATIVE